MNLPKLTLDNPNPIYYVTISTQLNILGEKSLMTCFSLNIYLQISNGPLVFTSNPATLTKEICLPMMWVNHFTSVLFYPTYFSFFRDNKTNAVRKEPPIFPSKSISRLYLYSPGFPSITVAFTLSKMPWPCLRPPPPRGFYSPLLLKNFNPSPALKKKKHCSFLYFIHSTFAVDKFAILFPILTNNP